MVDQLAINYSLYLADNALLMGHRLSEWTGHGPILEQDIAITNIALDYIGQARNCYQYAAALKGNNCTEDELAYLRKAPEFKNCLLTEQPNGDWAQSILKIFFFSTYQYYLYQQLVDGSDKQVGAIAEKSLKEITYHVRWSSEWVIRLGDGTEESHHRMMYAIEFLAPFISEFFIIADYEPAGIDYDLIKAAWIAKVSATFKEATLPFPELKDGTKKEIGKEGYHSNHLTDILNEMQYMQRTYPNSQW